MFTTDEADDPVVRSCQASALAWHQAGPANPAAGKSATADETPL